MRKPPDKKRAAPVGSITRGGKGFGHDAFSEGIVPTIYLTKVSDATEFAARLFSRRYRLAPHTARLVCHLAGIGGGV